MSSRADTRILSLSCVYPNLNDPGLGLFVRSRLSHLSRLADVKVVAPIAEIDYARSASRWFGRHGVPLRQVDAGIEVLHPAWVYPPGGQSLNAILLFLRLVPLLAGIRASFDFDVIDAHFAFPDGIAACLLAGVFQVPFTVTLRGNETMHARYQLRRRLIAWSLRKASRVITLSETLRQFAVSQGADRDKVKTIPNGVDAGTFFPRDRIHCRHKYNIHPDAKVVLSAGTLIERKGHHLVVRAMASLVREDVNRVLLIVGGSGREGRYEEEIRRQVAEFGIQKHVRFLGEVPPSDLAELMCSADVLCLASSREGWPNVVHEAMACGVPVVATNVGAVADMIPSPDYGFIVPIADPESLEKALNQALSKEWDHRAISALAHSRSWEQVAREVFFELREIATRNERKE
jgi:teichuronic acid biosynthesis glycosyltransferase TuaC